MSSASASTPCVNICAVSGRHGLCIGCGRTLSEIAGWGGMSEAQRRAVMAELGERLRVAKARSGAEGA